MLDAAAIDLDLSSVRLNKSIRTLYPALDDQGLDKEAFASLPTMSPC